jgi:ATP-dependent Clp protease protease subunit
MTVEEIKNIKPDIPNILTSLVKVKPKDIDKALEITGALNRHLIVEDIEDGMGLMFHSYIYFWNYVDNMLDIPIKDRQPIKFIINSNGGDLNAAFTALDTISMSKTPVWTINIGAAYSSGLLIFLAGHKRFCYPHSSFLFHEGSAGMGGTAIQFEGFSQFYKKQLKQMREYVLSRTNISSEKYEEIHKDDYWMVAEEALELGCVDEIIDEDILLC